MYSDTLVIPKDFISNISLNGEVFATRITSYYDASNFNLVATENHTAGVTCQPTTPDKKPSKVKIGDHGVLSTLVCDNNTSQKSKWRVEDAGNNRISLINTTELMDQSSSLLVSSETIYTINLAGDIEGYKKIANLRDGHQLTIQGTNITEKASLAQSAINRITAIEPNDMKVLDVDLEKTCSCSLIQLERRIPFRCIVLLNIIYEEDGRKGQTKLLEMWDLVDGDWEYGFPDTLRLQDCPGEKR
jgi:hypothetical protein